MKYVRRTSGVRAPTIDDYNKHAAVQRSVVGTPLLRGLDLASLSSQSLTVSSELNVTGFTNSLGTMRGPLSFVDGSSISGTPNGIVIKDANGASVFSTSDGALDITSITSQTGAIDFNGVSLVNVGGFSQNAGYYDVVGDQVTTSGAAWMPLVIIPAICASGATVSTFSITLQILTNDVAAPYDSCARRMLLRGRAQDNGIVSCSAPSQIMVNGEGTASSSEYMISTLQGASGAIVALGRGPAGVDFRWQAAANILRTDT